MKWRIARLCVPVLMTAGGLLAQPGPPNRVAVLIGFNQPPGPNEQALVRTFGGVIKHTYRLIPAIAASLPPQAINALANNPAVSVIEPDAALHALDEYTSAWGVAKINAKSVQDGGNRGAGIKVCVVDSGIQKDHSDLSGNYAGGYDFVNADDDPSDDNGHGTHVAGTIAALLNGIGVVGVAPQVSLLVYKILNSSGSGSFSDAIAAVQQCQADGGKITSNSYGSGGDPGTLVQAAFDNAYNAGILHVAAAGNASGIFGCNSVSYPARYSSVIAVAATDSSDNVASFSCRGPEVELSAPGVNIQSTYLTNTYATASGTSMATPHVSGLAALVFGCGLSDLNGDGLVNNVDVRLRMQQTALDLGAAGRDSSYGFGRIRADQAAIGCATPPPPATAPNAPSGLSATPGKNYVALSWTDNSDNETNFVVERCSGIGCTDFVVVATLTANTTSYTSTGLGRRRTYRFRVKAANSAGSSGYASPITATTQ